MRAARRQVDRRRRQVRREAQHRQGPARADDRADRARHPRRVDARVGPGNRRDVVRRGGRARDRQAVTQPLVGERTRARGRHREARRLASHHAAGGRRRGHRHRHVGPDRRRRARNRAGGVRDHHVVGVGSLDRPRERHVGRADRAGDVHPVATPLVGRSGHAGRRHRERPRAARREADRRRRQVRREGGPLCDGEADSRADNSPRGIADLDRVSAGVDSRQLPNGESRRSGARDRYAVLHPLIG